MTTLIHQLQRRRKIMFVALGIIAFIALSVSLSIQITPLNYFDGVYNMEFIYALIIYKLLELPLLYIILYHRHIRILRREVHSSILLQKFLKHAKLFLFLIVQGNTIFGLIAYKLSGNILFFFLFSCIAFITLTLLNPRKLNLEF